MGAATWATPVDRLVLVEGNDRQVPFHLLSSNGKVVASSEAYETKRTAMAGIESVRKHAAGAALDDQTQKR